MKTCLYRPITLNIIAYQIFPQLYDIQPSLDSYVEQAHFNGTLLIDNLTDNTKTTYQYVSMIDFTSYAGKHIRISNSNQLGNVFVGEWNIEGTPLPEIEMPESIKEHMVLWYDIARQGATNESMAANPILRDFSGNNHNGECIGFDWTSSSGIQEKFGFDAVNTELDNVYKQYTMNTQKNFLELLTINGIKESTSEILLMLSENSDTIIEQYCKFEVTGLDTLISKYPEVKIMFTVNGNGVKYANITKDGTYEYALDGKNIRLRLLNLDTVPTGDNGWRLTIKQYPKTTGAIVSDGVDDWVYVPNLPRLTSENGFTVIAQRQRLGDPSIYAAFASKATDATETDGAFILERFDSNGDVNNVRVRSFGAVTNITEAADDIIWCTSHKYQGINLTVGDDEDSTELALFKFSCNPTEQYCGKYAMYKFLLFDKDLSEKEIAWVMSYLMGVDFTSSFLEIHTEPATITYEEQNYRYESRLYWYITNYGLDAEYVCRYYWLSDTPRWVPNQEWFSITETGSYLGNGIYFRANVEQNDSKEQRTCTITNGINTIKFDSIDVELPPIQAVPADAKVIVQITQEGNPTPTFKTATEAVAGDAVLYDQTNDHLVIVDSADLEPYKEGYTPIGVVVIPGNHDVYGDGSCGVMSLKEMNCDTPDTGGAQYQGIRWGQYKYDLDIPNYTTVTRGNTEDGSTTGDATYYSYLPSDKFSALQCLHDTDAYYYSSDILSYQPGPSPYKTDGSRNLGYSQTNPPSSSSNALSDFNGRSNSKILWDNATAQSNWKIAPTIINEHNGKYSPAACCCWRYHTEGTQQGDWYLPAEGELSYVIAPFNKINEAINNVKDVYDSFVGVVLSTDGNYWSSSQFSNRSACRVFLEYGEVHTYYNKGNYCYTRAFLKVNDSMLQPKPEYNFIDLGLPSGNLWCDRNLGASSPEDAGLYFQWGDTQGYSADQIGTEQGQKSFIWGDYKFSVNGSDVNFSKYNNGDGKSVLDLEDDAANIVLGQEYRIPTKEQWEELLNNTDIYLVESNGREIHGTKDQQAESSEGVLLITWDESPSTEDVLYKGIKLCSKTDKSIYIFLPSSGKAMSNYSDPIGVRGAFNTASIDQSNPHKMYNHTISFDKNYAILDGNFRYVGVAIRAIKPGEQTITNAVLTENNEALLLEDNNPIMLES